MIIAAVTYIPISELRDMYSRDEINELELDTLTALAVLIEEESCSLTQSIVPTEQHPARRTRDPFPSPASISA